jgi:hypothetical protein
MQGRFRAADEHCVHFAEKDLFGGKGHGESGGCAGGGDDGAGSFQIEILREGAAQRAH